MSVKPTRLKKETPEDERAFEEGSKLFHDTFKHLTTLSTGSVLLIATFFEKSNSPQWNILARLSLIGFTIATLGSVLLMLFLAKDVSIGKTDCARLAISLWILDYCGEL